VDDPATIATQDLAVVGDIASDKLAKYEGWGRASDAATVAGQAVDRLSALEGKIKPDVTVERTHREACIDVTPSKIAD